MLSALLPARDPSPTLTSDGQGSNKSALELLILDLPFSGLDLPSRTRLSQLLITLHAQQAPRILLALREGDPLPAELISHVLWIKQLPSSNGGEKDDDAVEVLALTREEYEEEQRNIASKHPSPPLPHQSYLHHILRADLPPFRLPTCPRCPRLHRDHQSKYSPMLKQTS
ncbi:unnamed protein product [Tilletia laevis]|uniref:Uncharacterized protein n=3 Tax=Tilletia TaxID=13289 RepID=A0A8X7SYL1_9BASI|nr:hypothetical protein CF336_g5162 [Tilletia laevis]KAE8196807.1 hypothetical protein CF328_g4031 [Tilletia controversa]CAD6892712.1 unnamed protein product [Tilletia caries]KAE8251272.1 hypothetical protein A4X06_0g2750 [Tilletia controversa]CAD6924657.1 unnamed protein product [Tilletia laevis]